MGATVYEVGRMSIEFYRRLKEAEAKIVELTERIAKLEAAPEKRPTLKLAKKD